MLRVTMNAWQRLAKIATAEIPPLAKPQRVLGYARASIGDQDNQRQIKELVASGVGRQNIFTDIESGRSTPRPGWDECWNTIRRGDLLVIRGVDRLGRDLVEMVQTVNAVHDKGANLKILSNDIDTRTPAGLLLYEIMIELAQWDRELMRERSHHGMQKARKRGVRGGAKSKYTDEEVMAAIAEHGLAGAGRHLRLSKTQVTRRRKAHLTKQEIAMVQEQAA